MGIKLFLTRKHIAECDRDMINNKFNLSIFEKLKNIFHIKQKPIKSIYRLYSGYGGILWPISFIATYLKSIF